jgi:hypothetical protein
MGKVDRKRVARALFAGVAVPLYLFGSDVAAQMAHRHGVGSLDLSMDGGSMSVQLLLPLENVVGFERPPRTAEERQKIEAARSRLRDPDQLFSVPPQANCRLRSAQVNLEAITAADKSSAARSEHHADARADYVFDCEHPALVRKLEIRLFRGFPSVQSLLVQVATSQGQRGERLSSGKRLISW